MFGAQGDKTHPVLSGHRSCCCSPCTKSWGAVAAGSLCRCPRAGDPRAGLGTGDGAAQSSARLEQQQLPARCDSAMGLRGGRTVRGDQDGL